MITTTGLLAKSVTLHCVGCQITSGSLVPSVVGGLIGGATVFGGVLFAEYLTRKRERIWRFDDERNNLLVRGADIFIPGLAYTREERDKRSLEYVAQLMLLRSLSRPLSLVRTGVRSIIRLETMEESEHRALWGALGVALVIAGVVILSDWTFVAVAAPPQRDLAGLWWPWVGALALMAVGVYVLVAISDERWWLPGRKDLKRRAAIRHKTVKFLARFRAHATLLLLREGLTEKDYQDWITNLCTFVAEAWGIQETMILFPNEVGNVPDVLKESAVRLVALIERCDGMTLKDDYDPDAVPKAEWLVYLDRVFSGTPEELA